MLLVSSLPLSLSLCRTWMLSQAQKVLYTCLLSTSLSLSLSYLDVEPGAEERHVLGGGHIHYEVESTHEHDPREYRGARPMVTPV